MDSLVNCERSNTILYSRRWSETVSFYRDQLGLPVNFENDWFVEFRLTASAYLSIANSTRASIQDVQGQGITLTWKVPDLARTKQLLDNQGIATTAVHQKWTARVFYIYDPEGHRIEFWEDHGRQAGRDE